MKNNKKIVATVEVRMTSTRLPGKVLKPLAGVPVLERIIERVRRSKYIDDIVVATTTNATDDSIVELCNRLQCHYYRGSEDDVIGRVVEAAVSQHADIVVETLGDCPLVDWRTIDALVEMIETGAYDLVFNSVGKEYSFPRGFDTTVFPFTVVKDAEEKGTDPKFREHPTLYLHSHPERYRAGELIPEKRLQHPEFRVTLDTEKDYELLNTIYERLYPENPDFSAEDVVDLLLREPAIAAINAEIKQKNPDGGFLRY